MRIVCILTVDYPGSEPCCEEFGVAKNNKKLLVVYKDPPRYFQSLSLGTAASPCSIV